MKYDIWIVRGRRVGRSGFVNDWMTDREIYHKRRRLVKVIYFSISDTRKDWTKTIVP